MKLADVMHAKSTRVTESGHSTSLLVLKPMGKYTLSFSDFYILLSDDYFAFLINIKKFKPINEILPKSTKMKATSTSGYNMKMMWEKYLRV